MVGGPVAGSTPLQPTVGHSVNFGVLQAYLEAYHAGADRLRVQYQVAASADAPAILEENVVGRTAGPERVIFNSTLPVRQLPPGSYTLRARVSSELEPAASE